MKTRLRLQAAALVLSAGLVSLQVAPAFAATPSELASLTVGNLASQVDISPDGTTAYVGSTWSPGTVSVIDIASRQVTKTITVGNRAYGIAFTPDGSEAYVVNRDSGNVSVINSASQTVTGTIPVGSSPYGVTFSIDGTLAYVANTQSNTVSVINTATKSVASTIPVAAEPIWLSTNPVSGEIYVVSMREDKVVKIIGTAVVATSSVITDAYSVSVTPDGSKLYVSSMSSVITVLDASTLQPMGTISVGGSVFNSTFSPAGDVAYFSDNSARQLHVIDVATNSVDALPGYPLTLTGTNPSSVAVTPDCTTAVVVVSNYPNSGFISFSSIVSTGQPSCSAPEPEPNPETQPNPTATTQLANTGTSAPQTLLGLLGAVTLLLIGVVLSARRRNTLMHGSHEFEG